MPIVRSRTMITSAMLIDWIRALSEDIRFQTFSPGSITWVDSPSAFIDERYHEEGTVLVFGSEYEAARLDEGVPAIVICESFSDDPSLNRRGNTLVVKTHSPTRFVITSLQRKIRDIDRWEHDLDIISAERGSYQEMLTTSRDILGNLITISDSTYHLIACTPDAPIDDPLTNELIRNGFHGEHAMARFREANSFAKWTSQRKTQYSESGVTKYPTMNHVFTLDGSYFIQMVMTCSNVRFSQGLLDTFDILVSHIKTHIRRCRIPVSEAYAKGTGLLSDLIAGNAIPRNIVAHQAQDLGLSDKEGILLYAIKLKTVNMENLEYIARQINTALPNDYVVMRDRTCYVIAAVRDSAFETASEVESALSLLIDFSDAAIAVSGLLPEIKNLREGARQTSIALKYSSKSHPFPYDNLDWNDPFARFEYYLFDYLLFESEKDRSLLEFCLDTSILTRLKRNSSSKRYPDDVILRCYLRHERSASRTAKALGIHRNTVQSRVEDIIEREHLNLDSPNTRIGIIALFRLTDYLDSTKLSAASLSTDSRRPRLFP